MTGGYPDSAMAVAQPRPGEDFLGKYRILRVVGEGGMGQVYSAHHLLLDKSIAIKVLSREVSKNPEHVTRFLNEARLAARIKSPHVCSVMDVGQLDDGRPFLVMELLEGGDLASALRARGTFPIWDIVDIALGALEGLAHAHVRGIVHRDLKPSNLFLATDPDGGPMVVKVLDFGISKFESMHEELPREPGAEPVILGSPAYMSPEQARDARSVDVRADIWSMGVILYELATGVCPFDAPTPQETFDKIRVGRPPPAGKLRDMPAVLDAAIARCMRRNPDERFATVLELAQAIAPIRPGADAAVARIAAVMARPKSTLADSSTGVPAIEPPPHATNVSWVGGSGSRTNRRAMGVGAAAGIAVLVAIGIVVVAQRKRAAPARPTAALQAPTEQPAAAPPAPASSSLPGAASSTSADAPPADPAPSASAPWPGTPARPARPHMAPKPSKQELLKDRR
jgi:serine/threonine protein kinase